ncbi:hypothetical protein [Micromonospora olivasterospora]|uniref:hypothetical protein n=1 Tax=Micromonospora olivasterospora TaxID=1880 RepID=UPI001B86E28B|nr:hypothetical protein [Micromonospora olivasterospora]
MARRLGKDIDRLVRPGGELLGRPLDQAVPHRIWHRYRQEVGQWRLAVDWVKAIRLRHAS